VEPSVKVTAAMATKRRISFVFFKVFVLNGELFVCLAKQ
ncbi:MAG: hypothetical protein ACI814_002783, partial [Mariniblastus sp.]